MSQVARQVGVSGESDRSLQHASALSASLGDVSLSWPSLASAVPDSLADLPLDEAPLVAPAKVRPHAGIRLADGRALAWAEYGNPRGVPCIVVPDTGSSRLSPGWMMHDVALPDSVRLLAIDRPGIGRSDQVGLGGRDDLAADIMMMIHTLAVGRVVMVGVGSGASIALDVAERNPRIVSRVVAVSARSAAEPAATRTRRSRFRRRSTTADVWRGPLAAWAQAAAGEPLGAEPAWNRARTRMDDRALVALGGRWLDADFRAAVVADLDEVQTPWVSDGGSPAPRWVHSWTGASEVQFLQADDDLATTPAQLRTIAAARAGWSVSTATSTETLFSRWPTVLGDAAAHYLDTTNR